MLKNRSSENEIIISFANETQVLKMESCMKKNNLNYKIKPIPREISTGCGLVIVTSFQNKTLCEQIIKDNDIKIEKIFDRK